MLSAPLGDLQVHRSEKHIFVKLQNKIIILKMSSLRLYTLGQIRGLTSRHRRAQCTKRTPSAQSTSRSAKKGFSLHNVHLSEDEFLFFPYGVLSKVWRGSQEGKLQGKQRRFPLSWKSQVQWSSFYTISDFKLSVMLLSGSARTTAQKILAPAQTNWESASARTEKGRVRAQSVPLHAPISLHQVNTTLTWYIVSNMVWSTNDISTTYKGHECTLTCLVLSL